MAASAGVATGYRPLFTPSNVWGPDGTPFDGTRTTSKKTKRKMMRHPARSTGVRLARRLTDDELARAAARHGHSSRTRK